MGNPFLPIWDNYTLFLQVILNRQGYVSPRHTFKLIE